MTTVQLSFEGSNLPANLDTHGRLVALRDDVNAGFLPFTHNEKSQAVEMLSYLSDHSQYPAGLGNRLQEIFIRQRGLSGPLAARRAMFSLAFEYGDYALNAAAQLGAVNSLVRELTQEHFNPGVTVSEDFPEGHQGIAAVVRFADVLPIREQNTQVTPFDPLRSRERRTVKANDEDEVKHKQITDVYTSTELDPQVAQRIEQFMETTNIGPFRIIVAATAKNELARYEFWRNRVADTRKHGAAWIIGRQILDKLQ